MMGCDAGEEVLHEPRAIGGGNALWMKLHAPVGTRFMGNAHHYVAISLHTVCLCEAADLEAQSAESPFSTTE